MTSIPTSEFQALKRDAEIELQNVHAQNFSLYTHNSEIKKE